MRLRVVGWGWRGSFPDPPPSEHTKIGSAQKKRHDTVVSVLSTACALPNRESRNENRAGAAAPGHTLYPGTRGEHSESYKSTLVKKDSAPQLFWLR